MTSIRGYPRIAVFLPQHQVIGVFWPDVSRTSPPASRTTSSIRPASMAAPRQLFPAAQESKPNNLAMARLDLRIRADHNASTIPHAVLPRQFMVASNPPLN